MGFKPFTVIQPPYQPKEPIATSIPQPQHQKFKNLAKIYKLNVAQLLRQMVDYCMENLDE